MSIFFLQHYIEREVPNFDTFQFISDANYYKQLKFPELIQALPVNPILIALMTPFFSTEFPELRAAVLICSLSVVLTLFLSFFYLRQKISKPVLLIIFLIMASNGLLFRAALNSDSIPLLILVLIITLILYQKKFKYLYLFVASSILVRYEALAIFTALTFTDLFAYFSWQKNKLSLKKIKPMFMNKSFKIWLYSVLVILAWFIFVYFHNTSFGYPGNYYVYEIFDRSAQIPIWKFFTRVGNVFLNLDWFWGKYERSPANSMINLLLFFSSIVSLKTAYVKKNKSILFLFIFSVLYLLIHVFFPADDNRYLFPVLIPLLIIVAVCFDQLFLSIKNSFLKNVLYLFLISTALLFSYDSNRNNLLAMPFVNSYNLEIKKPVLWFNEQDFTQEQNVIQYGGTVYFDNNDQVNYLWPNPECQSIRCILDKNCIKQDVWVVESYFSQEPNPFSIKELGVLIFNNQLEEQCLEEKAYFDIFKNDFDHVWSAIYLYDYEKCQLIDLGDSY